MATAQQRQREMLELIAGGRWLNSSEFLPQCEWCRENDEARQKHKDWCAATLARQALTPKRKAAKRPDEPKSSPELMRALDVLMKM